MLLAIILIKIQIFPYYLNEIVSLLFVKYKPSNILCHFLLPWQDIMLLINSLLRLYNYIKNLNLSVTRFSPPTIPFR
jgi:hypothetical protein